MRSFRRDHRGLAEIVGTLMLVVIVVAAATAFSFFVTSYERQVLSEESQQHDRTLETGRVSGIQVCTPSACPVLYCLDGPLALDNNPTARPACDSTRLTFNPNPTVPGNDTTTNITGFITVPGPASVASSTFGVSNLTMERGGTWACHGAGPCTFASPLFHTHTATYASGLWNISFSENVTNNGTSDATVTESSNPQGGGYSVTYKNCTGQHLPTFAIEGGENVLSVTFVSADVNAMYFTGYSVDGQPPEGWLFYPATGVPQWMSEPGGDGESWAACQPTSTFNGSLVSVNASCSEVQAYQQVNVTLLLSNPVTTPVLLKVFTALADAFTFDFAPPVPIIKTTVLPQGNYSEPLFDGSASYQPAGGDNASITGYSWTFTPQGAAPAVNQSSGPQVEVYQLSSKVPNDTYLVTLTVTNSDGLSARTSVYYTT